MEIEEFKTVVSEYMNRDAEVFGTGVFGKTDKILAATNMAKAWAQRAYKFERTRTRASLTVDKLYGGDLKNAVLYGTDQLLKVRSISKAFMRPLDGSGLVPIDIMTRDDQIARLQRNVEQVNIEDRRDGVPVGPNYLAMVQHGLTLSVWPWSDSLLGASTTLVLDIWEFLPEYSETVVTDFFLQECLDWLLFRTVSHLNLYLKEDQRVPITARAMEEAWDMVKAWDTSLIQGTAPVDLD